MEIPVGKSTGSCHSIWKLQKLWAAGWGDAYVLFFLVSSADLATLCNFYFFREVKLNQLMFVDEFSNRMVCKIGKQPSTLVGLFLFCFCLSLSKQ